MKKIYITILMFLAIFLNIDSVRAKDVYDGTCVIKEQSKNICVYSCDISPNDEFILKFDYQVSVSTSGSLEHKIIDESVTGGIVMNYPNREVNLVDYPVMNYFLYDGNFTCSPVIVSDEVNTKMKTVNLMPGTVASTILMTTINEISIKSDSSYTPENRPGYEQDEIDISCGFLGGKDSEIVMLLQKLYKYLKIILPVIIIALSIVDFIKVIGTGKDDDMKKAISKFIKRIIIAIIFILVPLIISIIIDVSGVTEQHSGIDDGLKAMFCIIK